MPRFDLKVDARHRITLPEPIVNSIGRELHLSPNTITALIRKKDASLEDIIKSTELLVETLKHELELQRKGSQGR